MCSVCRFLAPLCIGVAAVTVAAQQAPPVEPSGSTAGPPTLRVCADPNNLPYSNDQKQGFENRIADVIANDLNMTVEYFCCGKAENSSVKR